MKNVVLLKPYSIWSTPHFVPSGCGYIAKFHFENGMWKEFAGGIVGISDNTMLALINRGIAKVIDVSRSF